MAKIKIANKKGKVKNSISTKVFNGVGYLFITFLALACLLPVMMLVSGSFTAEGYIRMNGYSLLPRDFSLEAYRTLLQYPEQIVRAYGVSIYITLIGTVVGLLLNTMTAYVISRKDFKYRNYISFFFYFTTLFNGGMVCTYIFFIQYLHLKDNLWAVILPGLTNVFYMLVMRSFVSDIPTALIESAKIDGAGEFRIFVRIVLPLLKSGLATIGLFIALGYWNDWYNAMLYLNSSEKFPLQYMLYNMLQQAQVIGLIAAKAGIAGENLPTHSLKLAMAVMATGPIILLYPFVQKYFVKGITIGAVKG